MKKSYRLIPGIMAGAMLLGGMMVQSAFAQLQDTTPGSFLVYPLFDIHSGNQTKIRITNNSVLTRDVRLLAVCPGNTAVTTDICEESNSRITLTPHATNVIDVNSTLHPTCEEGFVVAFAIGPVDPGTGLQSPISYNALTGSYQVIYGGLDTTTEAGQAITNQAAQVLGSSLGTPDAFGNLALSFGGATPDYQALPLGLVGDFAAIGGTVGLASQTETATNVILVNLNIFTGADNIRQTLTLATWDQTEHGPFSNTASLTCWARIPGGSAFTKAPAGSLGAAGSPVGTGGDYGSLRVLTPTTNPNGYLGAIEEVSSLGGVTARGNTIRNLFHAGTRSAAVTFVTRDE